MSDVLLDAMRRIYGRADDPAAVLPSPHRVVRASAGAGKTYLLTTRYLRLLRTGEPVQNILATTFTRKAAGEIFQRVLGRLADACADADALTKLRDDLGGFALSRGDCIGVLRSLTRSMNRLGVGTIDGFFNRAARAMSFELGLPPDPRMIDEGSPLARQLRANAIHAVLGEAAADDGFATLIEMLRRLHHDTAQRSVTDAIDQVVTGLGDVYRLCPARALWDALPTAGSIPIGLLSAAIDMLIELEPDLPKTKKGEPNATFANAYRDLVGIAQAHDWEKLLENGLVKKVAADEPEFARAVIDDALRQAIYPLFIHAKSQRIKALADQTLATFDLLNAFDRRYTALRRAHRVMLFSDLTDVLAGELPAMGASALEELCFRLDARVTHLLLDEFQDTSLRQWAVLEPFAAEVAATADGSRSLFCVGDTKQAIYGWRGGCAELFDAVEHLPGIDEQARSYLRASWRSSPVVLDAVNAVFGTLDTNAALDKCRDAAVAWQAGFKPHVARRDAMPGHVVLQTTTASGTDDDIDEPSHDEDEVLAPADAHARFVARYIRTLHGQSPGRSIGVLVRRRKAALPLLHELRALGVNAAEEGGNPIDHEPAVAAVLSAIQLADHPGDSAACFHVLNSPVAGVLGLQAGSPVAHVDAASRKLRRSLLDDGYAAVIAGWTRQLAPSCDARSLRRLTQLVELAERFDAEDAGLRPGFFVQTARAVRVDDPVPASVRVMTVHASKGLEFDTVVLPDLDGELARSDTRELVVLDRDSPIAAVRGVYRRPSKAVIGLLPELERAAERRASEKRTEDLCLLYVAMTRARHALHLLVRPLRQGTSKGAPTGKPTSAGLTNLSYAAVLRQALCDDLAEGFDGGALLHESGDAGWVGSGPATDERQTAPATPLPPEPIELASPAGRAGRSWVETTPSSLGRSGSVSAADLLRLSDPGGRVYGSAVHAVFERIGFVDEDVPDAGELLAAAERFASPNVSPAAVVSAVQGAIGSSAVNDLLSRRGAAQLWRERPFVVRLDDRLVRGVFDRVHLWYDGDRPVRALLIDYKTDRVDDSTADAVAAEYEEQIKLYRAALAAMLGVGAETVEARLVFVGDARVVSVG